MKILIVVLQHGNEIFGEAVAEYFKSKDIDILIANPKAYALKKRFVETDMNRSFRKQEPQSYEEKRAQEVYEAAITYDFVIDIHTTTSNVDFVPIIASLGNTVKRALSFLPCENIAIMKFEGVKNSLIGSIPDSISMEFNEIFAKDNFAIEIIDNLITGLDSGAKGNYKKKRIYKIIGSIPSSHKLKDQDDNFLYNTDYGYYPFLVREANYHDYQGFYAKETKELVI